MSTLRMETIVFQKRVTIFDRMRHGKKKRINSLLFFRNHALKLTQSLIYLFLMILLSFFPTNRTTITINSLFNKHFIVMAFCTLPPDFFLAAFC